MRSYQQPRRMRCTLLDPCSRALLGTATELDFTIGAALTYQSWTCLENHVNRVCNMRLGCRGCSLMKCLRAKTMGGEHGFLRDVWASLHAYLKLEELKIAEFYKRDSRITKTVMQPRSDCGSECLACLYIIGMWLQLRNKCLRA